jgi:hypothetical protein
MNPGRTPISLGSNLMQDESERLAVFEMNVLGKLEDYFL